MASSRTASTARVNTRKTATAAAVDAQIKPSAADKAAKLAADQAAAMEALQKDLENELHMSSETFWEKLGFRPFSMQTTLTKLVARVVLYAVGAAAAIFTISVLSLVLQAAGWPLFLVSVIEIVGMVLGIMASWVASDALINYVAAGNVSRDIKRASTWVKDRFTNTSSYVKQRMAMH